MRDDSCSTVDASIHAAVVIYEWISACREAERDRGGKGKHGKVEHLKRSHAETG